MKLCMIGTGYVGLVSGVCFSDLGNTVYCVDNNKNKIDLLNDGKVPIYEPGLEEILKKNYKEKRLIFTTDLKKAVLNSDIIFICVGTPTLKNSDSADLKYVFNVAKQLKKLISRYKIIVTKSTVPVCTGDKIENILSNLTNKNLVDVVSNPEFLREGEAIRDFIHPDRVIIGTNSKKANKIMNALYMPIVKKTSRYYNTSRRGAELIKYASNAFLATKITYINELANLFFEGPTLDAEALEFVNQEGVKNTLEIFKGIFANLDELTIDGIKDAIKETGVQAESKGKLLFMPIRIATTMQMHGPELPNTLVILGKEKVINNIDNVISKINKTNVINSKKNVAR